VKYFYAPIKRAQRFPVLRLLRRAACAYTSPGGVACLPARVVVRGAAGRAAERPDTMHAIHRYIGLVVGDSPVKVLRDSVQRSRTRPSGDCARGGGAAAAADP